MNRLLTGLSVAAWLGLFAWAMPVAMAQNGAEDEHLLKAAFIYNFAKFTRWPDEAMAEAGAPLSLCVAGTDELADALGRLRGRLVRGHPLGIQILKDERVPKGCHMLYVAASEHKRAFDLARSAHGQPTLTISGLPGFARSGGIIELYHENERVRFIVNLGVARAAGLEISPSLLKLAVAIEQQP